MAFLTVESGSLEKGKAEKFSGGQMSGDRTSWLAEILSY
jgi:hypothetical protein